MSITAHASPAQHDPLALNRLTQSRLIHKSLIHKCLTHARPAHNRPALDRLPHRRLAHGRLTHRSLTDQEHSDSKGNVPPPPPPQLRLMQALPAAVRFASAPSSGTFGSGALGAVAVRAVRTRKGCEVKDGSSLRSDFGSSQDLCAVLFAAPSVTHGMSFVRCACTNRVPLKQVPEYARQSLFSKA